MSVTMSNGYSNGSTHVPHDSALSVGSAAMEDAARIKMLEEEAQELTEKVASACEYCVLPLQTRLPC